MVEDKGVCGEIRWLSDGCGVTQPALGPFIKSRTFMASEVGFSGTEQKATM
jgi:hypothetical protein